MKIFKIILLLITEVAVIHHVPHESESGIWPITCTFNQNCIINQIKRIEKHWKPIIDHQWLESKDVQKDGPDRYVLSMFPYPSGSLHLGHVKIYTCSDIVSRYFRMNSYKVTHPMGWDSFGLPAEKAAIERSLSPFDWTYKNIETMRNQLENLSFRFNWREATSDPSYYRWTQWLFLQLYKSNLAYKSLSAVNWDPVDNTVLADEQVDDEGRSWRSGAKVEKRFINQWNIKINSKVEELYKSTDVNNSKLGNHWEEVLSLQRPWIGEPKSYIFYFQVDENILPIMCDQPEIMLSEDCFIHISDSHWLRKLNIESVINPFTNKKIPLLVISDKKMLPTSTEAIIRHPCSQDDLISRDEVLKICKDKQYLGGYFTSYNFRDWVISRQRYWGTPIPIIICNKCGNQPVDECDLPVVLPFVKNFSFNNKLPQNVLNKLSAIAPKEWIKVMCPKCGSNEAVRETDTCDTFFDSSWYFLRYATEADNKRPFDYDSKALPIFVYMGGSEHARSHIMFSRFIYKFLRSKGFLSTLCEEPFERIILQGIVKGKTYKVNGRYLNEEEFENLKKQEKLNLNNVVTSYEKMSKSKGNGVDPLYLIAKYGIDATRACILGTGNPRLHREWKGAKSEFESIFVFLRRLFLTIEQFIYVRDVINELPLSPVARRFKLENPSKTKINQILEEIWKERNRAIKDLDIFIEKKMSPGQAWNRLIVFFNNFRKYTLYMNVTVTDKFQRCLADTLIMLNPIMPHVTEECWAALKKFFNKELKEFYHFEKLVCEQDWPKIE